MCTPGTQEQVTLENDKALNTWKELTAEESMKWYQKNGIEAARKEVGKTTERMLH